MNSIQPITLIILDGWGLAPPSPGNAVIQAETPNFDRFWSVYPHTQLQASGEAVGLPPGDDGNSEAGHLNIGAGNIVYQDLPRINMAVAEGTFFKKPAFITAANHVRSHHSSLHLMGLISDAAVHSQINHLFALLRFAREQGLKKVFLHLFTDGRDSPPASTMTSINRLQRKLDEIGIGQIATLIGRYWAMDRTHHWERTRKAYELLVAGVGKETKSIKEAVSTSYEEGKTDEFIEPIVILGEDGKPRGLIKDNDAVIFFNFRIDRPRQLTKALVLPDFESLKIRKVDFDPYAERYGVRQFEAPEKTTTFKRVKILKGLCFVTMTQYERGLPTEVVFPPIMVKVPLARVLSEQGVRQLHIAETEKFPHVTYFFNGGREKKFPGEEQVNIQSPPVPTYDEKPTMSIAEVTNQVLKRIRSKTYKFILINFANPDMVGHTGNMKAAIEACEATDKHLGMIVNSANAVGNSAIITADHGNVEEMINLQTGKMDTEHSSNTVPFIVINKKYSQGSRVLPKGVLADIAPTILKAMGINPPSSMSGRNLLRNV